MVRKFILGCLILSAVAGAFGAIFAPRYSDKTTAEEHVVNVAVFACEKWTEQNSKLEVERFTTEYELSGLPAGKHAVNLDYWTKGAGLSMHTRCDFDPKTGALLRAESKLK